jgi:thiol:disulfide interchange protein
VIFFIVFVAFALSFFGLYEITLPSSITNSTDSKANAGTVTGIFFMALTLTIVSFSCTGPLAGSLLAGAVSGPGGAMRLTFGMAGFGAALGLPFALFALFPEMLKSLPKSGGWLTTVKVVLGFLELGFAFKFLSNADLVMHWGLLKREIFIGIWIIIGALLSLYLWGILKFKNDAPIKKLSIGRILVASFFTIFTLYLLPGVTNTKYANLSLISGFPPPLNYSIYSKGDGDNKIANISKSNNCVLDLNCSHDYEEGLKMAKEQHKPILLDFTGYACVNCRRMEENVWSDPQVYKLMKEKFIVISLYVDDKKNLPSDQRFTYTAKDGNKRDIKTVGDKWSVFETENFKSNSQPLYAILNTNEELITVPSGYAPNVKDYLNWLQAGFDNFEKK